MRRIRAAGGMVAAKANLDEFAMGSSTEHSAFGRVLHPLDPSRVPGGSSGGSAALVAAGAHRHGTGHRNGRLSPAARVILRRSRHQAGIRPRQPLRAGGVRFIARLRVDLRADHPCCRRTALRHLGLRSARRHDARSSAADDADSANDLRGMVVGLPREYFPPDLHPGIRAGCDRAIAALKALGAEVREVSLPHTRFAVPTYYIVNPAEAAANLARFDGVRYGPAASGRRAMCVRSIRRRAAKGSAPRSGAGSWSALLC